jgi:putative tryptophan/tyrosine transport system substrate-binding protein
MIGRRSFISLSVLSMLTTPLAAGAQPRKMWHLGVLSPFSSSSGRGPSFQAFRDRLRELGYVEGENIAFEYRWAEGRHERLPELAAELVHSKVNVVLSAWSTPAALAAKSTTTTIPIVFIGVGDAVGVGLVASLARPGGNVTGSTFLSEETVGKQLQLLKEVVPGVSRIATLSNPANPVYGSMLQGIEAMGRRMNVQVIRLGIQGPDDVEPAFDSARRERVGGLVVLRDPVLITHRVRLVGLAAKHRLPVIYGMREFVDAGGLMSFEPNLPDLHRRAAELVVKILKGAKPADLPVEQSSRFDLVINLKTAKTLGLTIPQSLLLRADQVIE